mgnify:CR=1 FL=1
MREKMCEWCGQDMINREHQVERKKIIKIRCCSKTECRIKESIKNVEAYIIKRKREEPKKEEVIGL